MREEKPCVICGGGLAENAKDSRWLKGNNAEPLANGQCCDICNDKVLVARLARMLRQARISSISRS